MKYLFYYYNNQGNIIFHYSEDNYRTNCHYMGYSLKEAVSKFRKDNNLQHKHIVVKKLY